jgi:hypothetical protein
VRKSLVKPLIYVLVAAQLMLAVPAMGSSSTPCEQMGMAAASTVDHCPCCPDGAQSMKECLATCTLAVAALPGMQVSSHSSAPSVRVDAPLSAPPDSLSEPPLKPPPIR